MGCHKIHCLHRGKAASLLLKLFINVYKKWPTIDARPLAHEPCSIYISRFLTKHWCGIKYKYFPIKTKYCVKLIIQYLQNTFSLVEKKNETFSLLKITFVLCKIISLQIVWQIFAFRIYHAKCFACSVINYSNRRPSKFFLQCSKCNKIKLKSIPEPKYSCLRIHNARKYNCVRQTLSVYYALYCNTVHNKRSKCIGILSFYTLNNYW